MTQMIELGDGDIKTVMTVFLNVQETRGKKMKKKRLVNQNLKS